MEENEDTTVLVKGRFRLDRRYVLVAFVLMRYPDDAILEGSSNERNCGTIGIQSLTILIQNTVFRAGGNNAVALFK